MPKTEEFLIETADRCTGLAREGRELVERLEAMRNDLMAKAVELDTTRQKAKKKEDFERRLSAPTCCRIQKSPALAPGFFFAAESRGALKRFAAVWRRDGRAVGGILVELVAQRTDRDAKNIGGMGAVAETMLQRLQDQVALDFGHGAPDQMRVTCSAASPHGPQRPCRAPDRAGAVGRKKPSRRSPGRWQEARHDA